MFIPKQFKPLAPPPYQEASYNQWRVVKRKEHLRKVAGYFKADVSMPAENWCLERDGKLWMSQTPMEMESQGHHARMASGRVCVCGLGLGTVLYNLLHNPKVTQIDVIEQDLDVFQVLLRSASWFESAVTSGNVTLCRGDALQWQFDYKPDLLLIDIWRGLGEPQSQEDVNVIQSHAQAKMVGWWGQELDAVSWLQCNGNRMPVTDGDLQRWQAALGFKVLAVGEPIYPVLVLAAAIIVSRSMGVASRLQIARQSNA